MHQKKKHIFSIFLYQHLFQNDTIHSAQHCTIFKSPCNNPGTKVIYLNLMLNLHEHEIQNAHEIRSQHN